MPDENNNNNENNGTIFDTDVKIDHIYCISVYMVDRAYGGPEEGGWWYDYGDPVLENGIPTPVFVHSLDEAFSIRDEMDKKLDDFNKGRPSIDSVLSQGRYEAVIDTDRLPRHFPETRPYYE